MSNPGEVTLCPTAPLTNIAMAMLKEPRLRDNVKDIVLMGARHSAGKYHACR